VGLNTWRRYNSFIRCENLFLLVVNNPPPRTFILVDDNSKSSSQDDGNQSPSASATNDLPRNYRRDYSKADQSHAPVVSAAKIAATIIRIRGDLLQRRVRRGLQNFAERQ
jgi:hypothetical protein